MHPPSSFSFLISDIHLNPSGLATRSLDDRTMLPSGAIILVCVRKVNGRLTMFLVLNPRVSQSLGQLVARAIQINEK
jgi:hypothetical protein